MDQEHGPQLQAGTIPRLSRVPMPRASHDNLRLANTASKREPVKTSNLPRPPRSQLASIVPPAPFGENVNNSLRQRYGWSSQTGSIRSRSPVRDALQAAQSNVLETTPPSSNGDVPIFEDGDENPVQQAQLDRKPRHRMSLSERTIETLLQISPSPSPTRRRRESQNSNEGRMGPPARPRSNLGQTTSTTPARSRPLSPVKQPFRPPGRSKSPTKELSLAAVPSPGSLFSPPRAFVRGGSSRIAKPMRDSKRSVSNIAVVDEDQNTAPPGTYTSKSMRVKPSYHDKPLASSAQRSLEAIFKDPDAPSRKLTINTSHSNTGLLKPRSRGETTLASLPAPKTKKAPSKAPTGNLSDTPAIHGKSHGGPKAAKSSVALRESIAKAKAARNKVGAKVVGQRDNTDIAGAKDELIDSQLNAQVSNRGLLRKRLDSALTSGHLNIAAMKLDGIPDEVMRMYEPGESSMSWAEMVDVTKFIAADNAIAQLEDSVFPDCSLEDVANDDDVSNQFGGVEVLDLHNNLLDSLPLGLRHLERLTLLDLSGNKLSNGSLEIVWQLPRLQDLRLARNQLSGAISIPNSVMANLRALNLQDNQIDHLGLTSNVVSPVTRLDVSQNRLRDLPWELLSGFDLVQLNASSNQLSVVALNPALGGFDSLKELDLSRNAIEAIEPELVLSTLQVFNINNNKLDSLPDLRTWRTLVSLQASHNQLLDLPVGFVNLMDLKSADLSQNNIKILDPRIANMESLTSLQLAGNPLRERKHMTLDTEGLKNELLKHLEPIDPAHSDETGAPSGERSATRTPTNNTSDEVLHLYRAVNGILDLGSKGLTTIDLSTIDLDASTPVHTCRLPNNDLTSFPSELLSHPSLKWSLKSLDLSHNPLATTYLTDDLFLPTLQSLYIVSTGLTSLDSLTDHLKAPELRELNISCHRLAGHLPWVRAWFPSCTTLLATDNWFSSIEVGAVRGLEVLDIRNNEIESLPPKIGLLGNHVSNVVAGRLRSFECGGNKFRVPRINVIEKGTEAVLRDLRRMIPVTDVPQEWKDEI